MTIFSIVLQSLLFLLLADIPRSKAAQVEAGGRFVVQVQRPGARFGSETRPALPVPKIRTRSGFLWCCRLLASVFSIIESRNPLSFDCDYPSITGKRETRGEECGTACDIFIFKALESEV